MMTLRSTLLGACLALPLADFAGHAQAAQPDHGRTIYVPPGATVIILPGPGAVAAPEAVNAGMPEPMPMMRLIEAQQAAMQRMMADMNAMFPPMPDPSQLIHAAFGSGTPFGTASAGGHGVCSESISIVDAGNGSAPIVRTAQSGDACGAIGVGTPQRVNEVPVPAMPSHRPHLVEASYPSHPVNAAPGS
jgi:hypothetical protein